VVSEHELPDLVEAAARATINERCASAFLHDVRGTMQALFSAFELLGRSAKLGGDNSLRVEKACDLARRAITRHEKSTLDMLQLLTLQHCAAVAVDLGELVNEVTHFLRNDAAGKDLTLRTSCVPNLTVWAERNRLRTLLVGLLTAAIDAAPSGSELPLAVRREGHDAVVCIGSTAAFDEIPNPPQPIDWHSRPLHARELTLVFARQFLEANGGRLKIDAVGPHRALNLYYPCLENRGSMQDQSPLNQG